MGENGVTMGPYRDTTGHNGVAMGTQWGHNVVPMGHNGTQWDTMGHNGNMGTP